MKKVAIVADSTCCLPSEILKKYEITLVPIIINHNDKSYRDGIDISPREVYRIMREKDELPKTSTPSPQDFLDTYRRLSEQAESIFCITLTGLLSRIYGTAQTARDIARESLPNTKIEVFDSKAAAGAFGFMVLESARTASQGGTLEQVIETASNMMEKVQLLAVLDTLYYLEKGGRIGKAAALAGSILSVKPIVEHYPAIGETTPLEQPRTWSRAIDRLLELVPERVGKAKIHAMLHHADALEEGKALKSRVEENFECRELYLTEFTPGMGVHTGPGLLAISFYAG
jgi:DegV family protein with EDD domain